jgi:hypothetical protein
MTPEENSPPPLRDDRIEWFTVRYRTILIAGAGLALIAAVGGWALLSRGAPEPVAPIESVETGARFSAIEGSVQVKRAGTLEWIDAAQAGILRRNDLVRTGAGATAEILFADGTQFNVRPDSLITIEESSRNPVSRQQRVALSIQSGEANFQTAARTVPGETTISTPTVRTTAERDTVGNIQVADDGDTGIRIFQGGGRAETTTGQQIQLASNEGLQVAADGTAGPKTALPSVPALVAPPEGSTLSHQDPSRAITLLLWRPVPGAASYRVLVDFSRTFSRPLEDRQGFQGTQLELRGLDASTYHWKVASVDADGNEGQFTAPSTFTIKKAPVVATKPPPLSVETLELRGNILHVRGRTAPGATLTLNGLRIEVQPDGSFNEFVMLEAGAAATVTVRSTGVNGAVTEQERPVVVTN